MRVNGLLSGSPADAGALAKSYEQAGAAGLLTTETQHDPFMTLSVAAQATDRIELQTAIAVAFARNPMSLAYIANDLQLISRGRLTLGLGSQIRAHITRRFNMPWSDPIPRMREMVAALRAIWRAWNEDERLNFRGDYYQHTLMTPFFSPAPNPFGPPRIVLAAVGERMAELAGEVADGIQLHPFTTARYIREVSLPAVERGLTRSGRKRSDFQVGLTVFAAIDEPTERLARQQLSFYGSTPAYRDVLALHGWGELQSELNSLSRTGAWNDMAALIDDDVLDAFALSCDPGDLARELRTRYHGLVDRVAFYAPFAPDGNLIAAIQSR